MQLCSECVCDCSSENLPSSNMLQGFFFFFFGVKLFHISPLYSPLCSWSEWQSAFMVKVRKRLVWKAVIATPVHYCGRNGRAARTLPSAFSFFYYYLFIWMRFIDSQKLIKRVLSYAVYMHTIVWAWRGLWNFRKTFKRFVVEVNFSTQSSTLRFLIL